MSKNNLETVIQFRITNELKEKLILKVGKGKLSDYIRSLIEKDCKHIRDIELDLLDLEEI